MSRWESLQHETTAVVRLAAPVAMVQVGMMLMGVVDAMMLGALVSISTNRADLGVSSADRLSVSGVFITGFGTFFSNFGGGCTGAFGSMGNDDDSRRGCCCSCCD